ncbi:uncharacterized protein A1O9_06691 [Exophiala aquamarina CBS 119918]|uniref:DUF6594 domain-containing protein n=1 Tax=Exophiala aquamarina CBS 119918 TaxID=1182545 RepID=A0A072P8R5_9EURO|nr:uncharacterized protein A1O9_06691 [Exophiala aquamarina CBS 119918]KEF56504.1 hypothetical protein A1O9_06691 [Exophiala aquamarina CBS 119918]
MENRLNQIDGDDDSRVTTRPYLGSRQADDARYYPQRKTLFSELGGRLKIYDELLKSSAEIYRLENAPEHHRQYVANLLWNDGSLDVRDREYIQHKDDLVYFQGDTEDSWVHLFVSKILNCFGPAVEKIFRTEVQERELLGNTLSIELFEKRRFDAFVNFLFTLAVVASVMGPVMLLYFLRNRNGYIQNTTAMGCTAAFALLCATATNAKRHEVIAVTAA